MLGDQCVERRIAFGQQPVAPAFGTVDSGDVLAVGVAGLLDDRANPDNRLGVFAQVFGQKLHLPLACAVGAHAQGLLDLIGQVFRQVQALAQHGAKCDQARGQRQHVERLALEFAASGRKSLGAGAAFAARRIVGRCIARCIARRECAIIVVCVYVWSFSCHRQKDSLLNIVIDSTSTAAASVEHDADALGQLAERVLAECKKAGASQAEVDASTSHGLNVNVRMGEVETIEHTRDRGLHVTVYFGQRKGSASTADLAPASIAATVAYACAIARHTEADPAAGLADPADLATVFPALDLDHPWALTAEAAIELAVEAEAAGRALDARITNSDGASVSTGGGVSVYANSLGFCGVERGTRHSLSCSLIADSGNGMQRDYWYTTARAAADLQSASAVGRRAAERALARLDARQLSTRRCPVLLNPEIARSLIGHLVGAVSGGALYRKASFLVDSVGSALFPPWFEVREEPHLKRGLGSAAFDGDGVATRASALIERGVLARYVLSSYSARRLGLTTTGNAGGVHNLQVQSGEHDVEALLRRMGRGLLVTELMGQGVNLLTGDYSRGAAGFWVEDGALAYPVEEIVIAGNLREMFAGIEAVGSDVDRRGSIHTGSILLGELTVAGE